MSRAHLIPRSIGGFVWAWTECKACNEWAGSEIEPAILEDDSIIYAVNALRDELPDLGAAFDSRTKFVARSEEGSLVEARRRDDEFEILTTKDEDGVRRQDRDDARAGLEKRLARQGYSVDEIEASLDIFDNAVVGVPFEIARGTYTHGTVDRFNLPFDGEPVTDAFSSLIAFRFLTLTLGALAYDARLDGLREGIRAGEARSDWHVGERGISRDQSPYQPQHLIGIGQTEPHVTVRVQLFNWNVWRVHFPRIATRSAPEGMLLDLKAKEIRIAKPRLLAGPLPVPSSEGD